MKHKKIIFLVLLISLLFNYKNELFASSNENEEKLKIDELINRHIKDDYYWHLWGDISIPLPVIIYIPDEGLKIFLSSKFHHGLESYENFSYVDGKIFYNINENASIKNLNKAELIDLFKDNKNIYYDFSITNLVFALLFSFVLLLFLFISAARKYKSDNKFITKGLASFLEPIILFVRDDIAKQFIPKNYFEKFLPYLLTLFFFIWVNNLLGLIPIIGGANLTGNTAVTMTLALITFITVNINGKKTYWKHIFLPPVPPALWIIMIPIEIIGILTKPFALMVRLFANITAGHIVLISIISLIFIFSEINVALGASSSLISIAFGVFLSGLELVVAAIQAYVFTLLSAMYIGQAVQEEHH